MIYKKNSKVLDFENDKLYISHHLGEVLVNSLESQQKEIFKIHQRAIRDLKIKNQQMLSCSFESLKITSTKNHKEIISIQIPNEDVWSNCWNENDSNFVYCGTHSGKFMIYDVRKPNFCLKMIESSHAMPLHSLNHMPSKDGVLSSSLSGIYLFDETKCSIISTGNCSFTTFHSKLILSTFLETKNTKATHKIFQLNQSLECEDLKIIQGFKSKNFMSKSCLFETPALNLLIASHCEESNQIKLWSHSDGNSFQTINSNVGNVFQVKDIKNGEMLSILGKDKLLIYKYLKY
jgi:WD40 repeat protein